MADTQVDSGSDISAKEVRFTRVPRLSGCAHGPTHFAQLRASRKQDSLSALELGGLFVCSLWSPLIRKALSPIWPGSARLVSKPRPQTPSRRAGAETSGSQSRARLDSPQSARNALVPLSSCVGERGRVRFVYRASQRHGPSPSSQTLWPRTASRNGLFECEYAVRPRRWSRGKVFLFYEAAALLRALATSTSPLTHRGLRARLPQLHFPLCLNQSCISRFGYILIVCARVLVARLSVVCVRVRVRGCGGVM
ncbi:hypothetical protein WMY93_000185 [Mugilogobius chulae]|uniref:Uncharacterized protein n=1 Tax=Mugilogobius chulae TaxID=88201 RepID=A0AAW0Q9A3_9GOBI